MEFHTLKLRCRRFKNASNALAKRNGRPNIPPMIIMRLTQKGPGLSREIHTSGLNPASAPPQPSPASAGRLHMTELVTTKNPYPPLEGYGMHTSDSLFVASGVKSVSHQSHLDRMWVRGAKPVAVRASGLWRGSFRAGMRWLRCPGRPIVRRGSAKTRFRVWRRSWQDRGRRRGSRDRDRFACRR
jgi:hypothetical protein